MSYMPGHSVHNIMERQNNCLEARRERDSQEYGHQRQRDICDKGVK